MERLVVSFVLNVNNCDSMKDEEIQKQSKKYCKHKVVKCWVLMTISLFCTNTSKLFKDFG